MKIKSNSKPATDLGLQEESLSNHSRRSSKVKETVKQKETSPGKKETSEEQPSVPAKITKPPKVRPQKFANHQS